MRLKGIPTCIALSCFWGMLCNIAVSAGFFAPLAISIALLGLVASILAVYD